jgi:hypothetical protein
MGSGHERLRGSIEGSEKQLEVDELEFILFLRTKLSAYLGLDQQILFHSTILHKNSKIYVAARS